jgi:hypothetical protein
MVACKLRVFRYLQSDYPLYTPLISEVRIDEGEGAS